MPEYAVQPWIAVVRGAFVPDGAARSVTEAFETGAEWWREQMARTFEVAPTVVYESPLDYAQLAAKHGDPVAVWYGVQRAAHDAGLLDNCDPKRAHYMIGLGGDMGGGMVGSENFGCPHILPGKAAITAGFAYTLLGEAAERHGFPEQPWFANERRHAIGALMHELGHVFGDGVSKPLDHTEDDRNLMRGWWNWPDVSFTPEQVALLTCSPFLR